MNSLKIQQNRHRRQMMPEVIPFGMDDAGSTGLDDFGDLGGADMFGDSEAEETEITPDGIEETPKKKVF